MTIAIELIIALVTGGIGVIVSAIALILGRYNVNDLRGIIAELKADNVERKKREEAYERRCARQLARIAYLTEGIRILIRQLDAANIKPCWSPEEWHSEDAEEGET
jgi:hypothetical protein